MIALADGYFSTLQLNDGTIRTKFAPDCNRVENGVQTTNNPDFFVPVAALGCEEQFRLGNYRYDDRLRGRPLPAGRRGARPCLRSFGFIDHCGRLDEYMLTDGTRVKSHNPPAATHSISASCSRSTTHDLQIEANFITVPYHMPSPWDGR